MSREFKYWHMIDGVKDIEDAKKVAGAIIAEAELPTDTVCQMMRGLHYISLLLQGKELT